MAVYAVLLEEPLSKRANRKAVKTKWAEKQAALYIESLSTLPPVRAADVLCMAPIDVWIYRDLSAHPGLTYGILSLMPANDD
jgi:hypothetical protein